jgi:ribosomal protein S18 acetylase RimI-like enzyme
MVIRAGLQADTSPDAEIGITAECLTFWRERSLLWQRRDLDRALASFTFLADVTTLADDCRFAGDSQTLVVRYDGLPFAAIAFCPGASFSPRYRAASYDDVSKRIANLTRRLVAPKEPFVCLVDEHTWPLLQAAYRVLEVHPEWQMVFRADAQGLDPGDAVALEPANVPHMNVLARRGGMQAFDRDPLSRGPWYGVWSDDQLVAQGGTHLLLDQAAEIGNVVTAKAYRRRGYGSQVVAALLRELGTRGYSVFLHVLKENEAAILFYEHLGFERRRTMILAQCCV